MSKSLSKLKILTTIRQGEVGGGESHLISLLQHLDRTHFEPIVLSFSYGPMVERLKKAGFKCYVVNSQKAFDIKVWYNVLQIMKKEKIDIVHAHGTRAFSNIVLQTKILGLPVIYTVHGWSFHDDQNYLTHIVRVNVERLLVQVARQTILVSDSNCLTAEQYIRKKNYKIIYNGVDTNKYSPSTYSSYIRKDFKIPHDIFLIGYIARITKQKAPLDMIDAFAKVHAKYQNVRLLMIGEGDMKNETIKKVAAMNLQDYIYLDDFRQDVPELLNTLDVFCLPSLWEGLPIALLEAMAAEKAVIATNVDGSKEIIQNMKNGILISPQKPSQLADSIIHLYENEENRKQLGKEARKTVLKKYDVSKMVKETELIYRTLINRN